MKPVLEQILKSRVEAYGRELMIIVGLKTYCSAMPYKDAGKSRSCATAKQ